MIPLPSCASSPSSSYTFFEAQPRDRPYLIGTCIHHARCHTYVYHSESKLCGWAPTVRLFNFSRAFLSSMRHAGVRCTLHALPVERQSRPMAAVRRMAPDLSCEYSTACICGVAGELDETSNEVTDIDQSKSKTQITLKYLHLWWLIRRNCGRAVVAAAMQCTCEYLGTARQSHIKQPNLLLEP